MSSLNRALSLEDSPGMKALQVAEDVRDAKIEDLDRLATKVMLVAGNGGSFSEQAAKKLALQLHAEASAAGNNTPLDVLIMHLIDAEGVLRTLNLFKQDGEVRNVYGVIAHHNNHGGVVEEYQHAIGRYNYLPDTIPGSDGEKEKLRVIELPVHHMLMTLGTEGTLKALVTQGQAYEQCRAYVDALLANNPSLRVITDYQDTATAAKHLADGSLQQELAARFPGAAIATEEIGIIGPESSAEIYGLAVRERGVQDHQDNTTRFIVARPIELASNQ